MGSPVLTCPYCDSMDVISMSHTSELYHCSFCNEYFSEEDIVEIELAAQRRSKPRRSDREFDDRD